MTIRQFLLIVSIFMLYSVTAVAEDLEEWQIHRAMFTETEDDITYPFTLSEKKWHPISIPHNWDNSDYISGRNGWYHFEISKKEAPEGVWAIYLRQLNMNVSVYLNHALLDRGGRFEEPMARNWNRPMLFVIPEGMIQQGKNHISIHVKAYLNSGGGIGQIFLGPSSELRPDYKWQFRLFTSTTIISTAMTFFLGLAMLLFWNLRRNEKMFFWFSMTSFLSSLYLSNHFIQNIPFSRHLWELLFNFSIDAFVLCLMVFTHRWLKLERTRLEKGLFLYLGISMVVMYFVPEHLMMSSFMYNHIIFLAVGAYITWMLFSTWYHTKQHWLLLPLAALIFDFVLSFHDWKQLMLGVPNNSHFLMPLAEPVMLIVVAGFLIIHFVQQHRRADLFSSELQAKVIETTNELEQKHQEVKVLEHKRLIVNERERILQELHDGIGGQLVSAITLANRANSSGTLKSTLQDALLDLRLVIDSLDEDTRDLSSLLGMLRLRLEPQLNAHDIILEWHINETEQSEQLGYEASLNILRIVQEAITNTIRHSDASNISLRLSECIRSGGLLIEVSDNGHGIQQAQPGRGLGHMKQRASRIGAELNIKSSSEGTSIGICLPPATP